MEHDLNILMIFGIKKDNFDPYNVLLAKYSCAAGSDMSVCQPQIIIESMQTKSKKQ